MMPVLGIRVVGIEDSADRLREAYVSTVTYSLQRMRPDAPRKRRASMPLPVGKMRRFKANPAGNTGNLKNTTGEQGDCTRGEREACATGHFWGRFAQRCGHNVRLIPSDLREAVCQTSEERHSRCSGDRGCTTSEHALCRGQGLNIKPERWRFERTSASCAIVPSSSMRCVDILANSGSSLFKDPPISLR